MSVIMPIVRLDKVSLSFGLKPLLHHIGLDIEQGQRVCLLGRNGEGKSSLLGLIARTGLPDSGEVWVKPGAIVGQLAQDGSGEVGRTVREVVMDGANAGAGGTAPAEDRWEQELRANRVMSRLALPADEPMDRLSGGWRRRALLGKALAAEPDLLLLDEPTNHLDIEAIAWLEEEMLAFDGALFFVSHDRAFVRRLSTRIVELDRGTLSEWPGGYDDYVRSKAAALEVEARHAALFDKKLAQEEVWIRQGIEARRTRNEGRVRALKALRVERGERRERQGRAQMRVQEAEVSGRLVFDAERVCKTFGPQPLIADFTARVMRGDRIGIIGPNGCGKSTLIQLLMGECEPDSGSIRRGTALQPAYFDQRREQLDLGASLVDNVTGGSGESVTIDGRARHVSSYLRDFLFPPERMRAPASMLSGGERNRLLLAKLFARPSNLLIMDEPTNDLDMDTLELLEERIAEFQGTLLLVSHDRAFLDNVVTSTWVFEGSGGIKEYVGGYSDWLRQRGVPAAQTSAARRGQSSDPRALPKPTAALKAQGRRRTFNEQRELEALPGLIESLEAEQAALTQKMSDSTLFRRDPGEAAAAAQRLHSVNEQLDAAFARWEALEC